MPKKKDNKCQKVQKSAKKAGFHSIGATIRTRRESRSPVCGMFSMLFKKRHLPNSDNFCARKKYILLRRYWRITQQLKEFICHLCSPKLGHIGLHWKTQGDCLGHSVLYECLSYTLRSCVHEILILYWTFSPQLEDNDTLKYSSSNFP